jgi:hypothetical protein
MDEKLRQGILDSHERGIRLRGLVDAGSTDDVTVSRAELRALVIEHALICGYSLGRLSRRGFSDALGALEHEAGTGDQS